MPTVSEIANLALNAVEGAITDAVITFELSENVKSATFDPVTATYPVTLTSRGSCRGVVETVRPMADLFPDYIVDEADILIFLEGYTTPPKEGWMIVGQGATRTIKRAQDMLLSGAGGYVIAS